ncbi:segregation/condensation protein A [Candidatus Poribacteria bacterium]|nr:segregation/condensation protein A [Candidatus Poribacteria bacterium]
MAVATLEFSLPQFQGPLDLLLHLIQKNEMDIHDIRIAEITDQYLQYLELMQTLDLDVASEYLVIASTLLFIKSESMLPASKPVRAASSADAREELVRQLLEYKRFKEASQFLRQCEDSRAEVVARPPDDAYAGSPTTEYEIRATLFDLLAAFQTILVQQSELAPEFSSEIHEEPITVEQRVHEILLELELHGTSEFGTFFQSLQSKLELICTFLAILELVRMRQIVAVQEEAFGPVALRLNPDRPDIGTFRLTTSYGYHEPEAID